MPSGNQYGKWHDFCRDSGSLFATIPGVYIFFVPATASILTFFFPDSLQCTYSPQLHPLSSSPESNWLSQTQLPLKSGNYALFWRPLADFDPVH
jgi:hypothetical protein